MRARDIMTSPVIAVVPETRIKKAAALLAEYGFSGLPVVDSDEHLVGMVTEADLVRDRVPSDPRAHISVHPPSADGPVSTTVGEVMSSPAVAVEPGTDVADLAATLLETHQRTTPVVDGSRLVGIVTRRDIVRTIAREDDTIATDVRRRLEVYGGTGRWRVEVHDGVVTIGDTFDDETDRHVAKVLAEAVPGVVRADTVASNGERP